VSTMRQFSHAIPPRGLIDRIEDEFCVSSLARETKPGIPMECRLWSIRRVRFTGGEMAVLAVKGAG
jgi:hypothetical protein